MNIRYNWTLEELQELYALPLLELISKSHLLHIQFHAPADIVHNRLVIKRRCLRSR